MKALFDVNEAAEYLGVNHTTVRDYVNQGLLAVVKLPKRRDDKKRTDAHDTPRRKLQFRQEDLDRFIAGHVIEEKAGTESGTRAVPLTGKRVIQRDWWKRANA